LGGDFIWRTKDSSSSANLEARIFLKARESGKLFGKYRRGSERSTKKLENNHNEKTLFGADSVNENTQ